MRMCPMPGGHYGKTLLRTDDMRLVLMVLDHGTELTEHHLDGTSTIQALGGRVAVSVLGSRVDLAAGQVLAIEQDVGHSLLAVDDCAILLTIAWKGHRRRGKAHEGPDHRPR